MTDSIETDEGSAQPWVPQQTEAPSGRKAVPINMVLYCPNCGKQHVDAPDTEPCKGQCQMAQDYGFSPSEGHSCSTGCGYMQEGSPRWTNPPHRSHLCHHCGCIWRPADVPTNGVAHIETKGKVDTWVGKAAFAAPAEATQPTQAEAPSEQVEFLDAQNHRLRRALFDMMKRLADLLDEDQFAEMESIALRVGVDFWHDEHGKPAFRAALATQQAVQAEPVAWRDHVEQRIRTWRQRTMNRSGDRLAIDDFMGTDSIDDLVDFVCDEYATPPAPGQVERINLSTFAWGVTRMGDNPKAVLVSFRSEPTDDDLRALHEALRPASGRTVHANAAQAGQVERDREDAANALGAKLSELEAVLDDIHMRNDQHRHRATEGINLVNEVEALLDTLRAARSSEGDGNE